MRAPALACLATLAIFAACRPASDYVSYDLSAPQLFCPASPPTGTEVPCDPRAVPYCTFPDLELTCVCTPVGARYALVCPYDAGATD